MKFSSLPEALEYAYNMRVDDSHPIYQAMDELETRCRESKMKSLEKVQYFNAILATLTDN